MDSYDRYHRRASGEKADQPQSPAESAVFAVLDGFKASGRNPLLEGSEADNHVFVARLVEDVARVLGH